VPNADGTPDFEQNSLHQWISRDKGTFIMQSENTDGTSALGIFLELKLWDYYRNHIPEFQAQLISNHPDLEGKLALDAEALAKIELTRLVTMKCSPWTIGKFLLMGDSAHSMNPYGGQGCNFGIADCGDLDTLVALHKDDWKTIATKLEEIRKP
jgi:kynurenine 3-monooxygenase